jgi:fructose-specific phosphotransferase system IIC component
MLNTRMQTTGRKEARLLAVSRSKLAVPALCPLMLLSGCGRAPSFSILGSFFPAWLFCIVAGILLTTVVYWIFVRLQLDKDIRPAIVVYPCLSLFFSFTLWLVFFS